MFLSHEQLTETIEEIPRKVPLSEQILSKAREQVIV